MPRINSAANRVIVLDFETTGLSPAYGDRAIEIGAIKIIDGVISDRFQSLMNPGVLINPFIESYTGISNSMLADAPPCNTVMKDFADFVGDFNLVAHNCSFDRKFLDNECKLIRRKYKGDWACSMLTSRRIFPFAPNHKLGTLVEYRNLPNDGTFHRALADAQMASYLWLDMIDEIHHVYGVRTLLFSHMQTLASVSKHVAARFLSEIR